ncbi:MAG: hypothetical protein COA52_00550 [Hyphomicrobiales bacterium]|nr:MAG: hypothetical protein COA52_00550 [Hyphomicrobiales bacterium]
MKKYISLNDLKQNIFRGPLTNDCIFYYAMLQKITENADATLKDWRELYNKLSNEIVKFKNKGSSPQNEQILTYLQKIAGTMMHIRDIIKDKTRIKVGDWITTKYWSAYYEVIFINRKNDCVVILSGPREITISLSSYIWYKKITITTEKKVKVT